MLKNAAYRTIKRSLSQDQFMSFEFSKSFIKDKYGADGLLRFTEYMRRVEIEDSHLNYNELLYKGELLARSFKQRNANY